MSRGARWHRATVGHVPAGDAWLTARELAVQEGLVVDKRRSDWRLGRWAAKSLVAAVLDVAPSRVEVRAADDGAPEAYVDGAPSGLALSVSHRDGVAVAACVPGPTVVGVDLETLEPRSDAFVREWLSAEEQAALPHRGRARDLQVLRCWTGKEASAKALREGLRLDVRHAVVHAVRAREGEWSPVLVNWHRDEVEHHGWWRFDGGEVVAMVTAPPADAPVAIVNRPTS
jgi:4'-phosphopantetheinyl transferase